MTMNRTYTIKDIAACVGVSTSTVSRVLSNAPSAKVVTESTRRKIFDAVEEFGYVPNVNARRLVQNKTNLIGIAIPADDDSSRTHSALLNRSLSETLGGLESVLKLHDYRLLLLFNDAKFQRQREYLRLFKENSVDGMIIWGPRLNEPFWEELCGYKAIEVNSMSSGNTAMSYAGHDNLNAAANITSALLNKGCRRILFIGGDPRISICRERRQGYEQSLARAGIAVEDQPHIDDSTNALNWLFEFEKLLCQPSLPFDAVQCLNDRMALQCGKILLDRHYRIPQDVIITGGDRFPDEYGELLDWKFPVISFEVDCFNLGRLVGHRLLEMLDSESPTVSFRELLPVNLVDPLINYQKATL